MIDALTKKISDLIAQAMDRRLPDYREVYVMHVSQASPLIITDGVGSHEATAADNYTPTGGDRVLVLRQGTTYYVVDSLP